MVVLAAAQALFSVHPVVPVVCLQCRFCHLAGEVRRAQTVLHEKQRSPHTMLAMIRKEALLGVVREAHNGTFKLDNCPGHAQGQEADGQGFYVADRCWSVQYIKLGWRPAVVSGICKKL